MCIERTAVKNVAEARTALSNFIKANPNILAILCGEPEFTLTAAYSLTILSILHRVEQQLAQMPINPKLLPKLQELKVSAAITEAPTSLTQVNVYSNIAAK